MHSLQCVFHYHIWNSMPDSCLQPHKSSPHPVTTFLSDLFVIVPSMPRSPKWINASKFSDQNSVCISHFPIYSSFPIIHPP